jgi:hypothetical protein
VATRDHRRDERMIPMLEDDSTMAQEMAQVSVNSPPQSIGPAANAVTVVLGGEALEITLGSALTPPGRKPEGRRARPSILNT